MVCFAHPFPAFIPLPLPMLDGLIHCRKTTSAVIDCINIVCTQIMNHIHQLMLEKIKSFIEPWIKLYLSI